MTGNPKKSSGKGGLARNALCKEPVHRVDRGKPFGSIRRRLAATMFLCCFGALPGGAGELPTNLDLIRALAGTAADSLAGLLQPGESAFVRVLPADQAWIIDGAVYAAFGGRLAARDSADVTVECALRSVTIRYRENDTAGLPGATTTGRTVETIVSATLLRRASGVPMFAGDISRRHADRIPLASIEQVENTAVPLTLGDREPEGFFSSIAEPLVLLAALGVAVFLLFHVRS